MFSIRPFATILDSCLGRTTLNRATLSDKAVYLPFRADQPVEYEPIQWQNEITSGARFAVAPPSPTRVLQPRSEPNVDQTTMGNNNNTNIILIDDNDDQNYVDAMGDEENEVPKVITKKKGKKKKQVPKVIETSDDTSINLNTSSNRMSNTGQKHPVTISL